MHVLKLLPFVVLLTLAACGEDGPDESGGADTTPPAASPSNPGAGSASPTQ